MLDNDALTEQLDEQRYAELRPLAQRQRRWAGVNGRKPNVASLYANLPPPPSEDEWRDWEATNSWKRDGYATAQQQ